MKKNRAYYIYIFYCGAIAFLFSLIFTSSQLYRLNVAHLTAFQIVFVGTILELSCFIFEIPTGILADLKSRKLSIITGLLLIGAAFIIEGTFPMFYVIILTQITWGLGATFLSGADEAWIADELDGENLDYVFLKGAQMGQLFSLFGIWGSMLIGSYFLPIPIILGGTLFIILGILLLSLMEEKNYSKIKREELTTYQQMIQTFIDGIKFIKLKPILLIMVFISLFYGLYSEGFDRLWQPHLNTIGFPHTFKPIIWIGIINTVSTLFSIFIVGFIRRTLEKKGRLEKLWMLSLFNIFMIISMFAFALSNQFILVMFTYFSYYSFRVSITPVYRAWMNQQIDTRVRATVLSTFGQIDAFGQIIGGPLIGLIASSLSIALALLTSSIILIPTIVLYFLIIYHIIKRTKKMDC